MKRIIRVIAILMGTVGLSTIVGAVFFGIAMCAYETRIEIQAEELGTLNERIQELAEEAKDIIEISKDWRIETLNSEEAKKEEFQEFLDTLVYNWRYDDKISGVVDKKNQDCISARLQTKPVMWGDDNVSYITIKWDYEYNVIEEQEFLIQEANLYKENAEKIIAHNAIKIGIFTELVLVIVLVVSIMIKIKRKKT